MYHITPFYPVPNHLYPSNESICGTLISSNLPIYTTSSREQTNNIHICARHPCHPKSSHNQTVTPQHYTHAQTNNTKQNTISNIITLTTLRNPITTVTIKYGLLIRIDIIWITCKMCGRYAIVTLDVFTTLCVWTLI